MCGVTGWVQGQQMGEHLPRLAQPVKSTVQFLSILKIPAAGTHSVHETTTLIQHLPSACERRSRIWFTLFQKTVILTEPYSLFAFHAEACFDI